jgi:nitric-oxide synthase
MATSQKQLDPLQEAMDFLELCEEELGWDEGKHSQRCAEARSKIEAGEPWEPSFEELKHGARVAWRNNARCIGRLFWNSLKVRDQRELEDPDEVAEDLREHIRQASNGGRIQPLVTVYAPSDAQGARLRIWNHQLFGYAGYGLQEDGRYLGDPKNEEFTRLAQDLGWQGEGTDFDLLPWIIQKRGEAPRLYAPPEDLCLQVPLRHPGLEWFGELGLKWYAVPILSDMNLRLGGLDFRAAPFNGWYMGTEIGSRDLGDEGRYNMLPEIGRRMGLFDGQREALWKDRALVELNEAVLHSFAQDGVRIVDHHRASSEFMRFVNQEAQSGRLVSGRWSWLVPPMSGSATEVFHRGWKDRKWVPDYQPQTSAWQSFGEAGTNGAGNPSYP